MKNTLEFLDGVKSRCGVPSDYALAKKLGVSQQAVSKWRTGRDFLSDSVAMRVAELLDLSPAYVVACVHAERSKEKAESLLWQGIAERFAPSICIMSNAVRAIPNGIDLLFRPVFR